jgi:hypothetical protein
MDLGPAARGAREQLGRASAGAPFKPGFGLSGDVQIFLGRVANISGGQV